MPHLEWRTRLWKIVAEHGIKKLSCNKGLEGLAQGLKLGASCSGMRESDPWRQCQRVSLDAVSMTMRRKQYLVPVYFRRKYLRSSCRLATSARCKYAKVPEMIRCP